MFEVLTFAIRNSIEWVLKLPSQDVDGPCQMEDKWSIVQCYRACASPDEFEAECVIRDGPCAGMPVVMFRCEWHKMRMACRECAEIRMRWPAVEWTAWRTVRSEFDAADDNRWGCGLLQSRYSRLGTLQPLHVDESSRSSTLCGVADCSLTQFQLEQPLDACAVERLCSLAACELPFSEQYVIDQNAIASLALRVSCPPLVLPTVFKWVTSDCYKMLADGWRHWCVGLPIFTCHPDDRLFTRRPLFECSIDGPFLHEFQFLKHFTMVLGTFPIDGVTQQPGPHIRRTFGAAAPHTLRGSSTTIFKAWMISKNFCFGSERDQFADAQNLLLKWMKPRFALVWPFFQQCTPLKSLEQIGANSPYWPNAGRLLFCRKAGGKDLLTQRADTGCQYGFHGTSPYCLNRIFDADTLSSGIATVMQCDRDLHGVFYYTADRLHICRSMHCHYIALNSCGWFFGPIVVIEAEVNCHGAEASDHAHTTHEGQHSLVGILWHIVHAAEIASSPATAVFNAEPRWIPQLEVTYCSSWFNVMALARNLHNRHTPFK